MVLVFGFFFSKKKWYDLLSRDCFLLVSETELNQKQKLCNSSLIDVSLDIFRAYGNINFCYEFYLELEDSAAKDIDLRVPIISEITASPKSSGNDATKRRSSEDVEAEEPKVKKSKTEKIDM